MKKIDRKKILFLILEGYPAKEIAKKLGVSLPAVTYHIKRLLQEGYIKIDQEKTQFQRSLTISSIKFYKLTEKGKLMISGEIKKDLRGSERSPRVKGIHAIEFKMKIIKDTDNFWYDHEIALKNWVKQYTWIGDIYIEKTTQHIGLKFAVHEEGDNLDNEAILYKNAYKALSLALRIKELLESKGYILGNPIAQGRPKIEIQGDPIAEKISKHTVISTDKGMIDNTPDPGTLHFYEVDRAIKYFEMPDKVEKIDQKVKDLEFNLQSLRSELREAIKEITMSVAKEVGKEVAKEVIKAMVGEFRNVGEEDIYR